MTDVKESTGINLDVGDLKIVVLDKKIKTIAWFDAKENAIYINRKHIRRNIVSHEMVHLLLYKYVGKHLPKKIVEIIPQEISSYGIFN